MALTEQQITYANYRVSDIQIPVMVELIKDLIIECNYVMGIDLPESEITGLTFWAAKEIKQRFAFMPMNHIYAAIQEGSRGQRGGTSKLNPRNLVIWLSEQRDIYQDNEARDIRERDAKLRNDEFKNAKVDPLFKAAVLTKIYWKCDGQISAADYDKIDSKKIYNLLKSGRKREEIKPREVMI